MGDLSRKKTWRIGHVVMGDLPKMEKRKSGRVVMGDLPRKKNMEKWSNCNG
jgi:hypothetical protein